MIIGIDNTQMIVHDVSTILAVILGLIVLRHIIKKVVTYIQYKRLEKRLTKIVDDALRKCDELAKHNDEEKDN